MKKVSIIIPLYNEEKYIKDAINSILEQDYSNYEIIVIDDGSTDNSYNIVNNIKDKRIKLFRFKKNKGVGEARNLGIKKASGDYLAFLDADDYWEKDKLKKQVNFMEKNNYVFSFGNYTFVNKKRRHKVKVPKTINYEQALRNTTIFISTVMIDLKQIDKNTIYMHNIKIGADMTTWWNILKTGIIGYGINSNLAYYRIKKKALSSNKLIAVIGTWKIYGIQKLSFCKKLFCWLCYIFNAIRRRIC